MSKPYFQDDRPRATKVKTEATSQTFAVTEKERKRKRENSLTETSSNKKKESADRKTNRWEVGR